jgi:hypothetical protein
MCADVSNAPGVYVNVPYFMPWIRGFIEEQDSGYRYSSIEG